MDLRRTAEMLLRAQPSVLPFLTPAFARPMAARPTVLSRLSSSPRKQLFATTRTRMEDNRNNQRAQPESTEPFSSLLDSALDGTKGVPTTSTQRTSNFKSPTAQQENRDFRPPGSNAPASPSNIGAAPPATNRADISNDDSYRDLMKMFDPIGSSRMDVRGMLDPKGRNSPQNRETELPRPLRTKLGPSLGRMININESRGVDVGRAFRQLEVLCGRNRIRADFNRQRFHERPGLKRKRLKSERWRRAFKDGFKGMVRQVVAMRRQGW